MQMTISHKGLEECFDHNATELLVDVITQIEAELEQQEEIA